MKNKNKHGFTLVELIVVLVILAVLAALLVPALTGYIDKARKSQVIAETRMITMAVQTTMSEYYSSSEWREYGINNGTNSVSADKYYLAYKSGTNSDKVKRFADIESLSEISNSKKDVSFGACVAEDGKVTVVVYQDGQGHIGIYFADTGEYVAYDESDFESFNTYFGAIENRVYYSPYYQDSKKEIINPMNIKAMILTIMGYKEN